MEITFLSVIMWPAVSFMAPSCGAVDGQTSNSGGFSKNRQMMEVRVKNRRNLTHRSIDGEEGKKTERTVRTGDALRC